MVSVCLPSNALSQHLPSYLGFSYLRCGVSLQGCSAKRSCFSLPWMRGISSPPSHLTLSMEWLLSALLHPRSHRSLDVGLLLSAAAPDLGDILVNFIFGGSKITAGGDCSHEVKRRLLLGRKVMTNLDSIFKSRDITLSTKVCLVRAMVFPVVMYGCES